jgi:DNA-directed RNA polymerase specialized sigma24 family protein
MDAGERASQDPKPTPGPITRRERVLRATDVSIVGDFASELDDRERRVFALVADGMRYRAIATRLGIPVNEARQAYRSYERKRQRFQILYDAGRSGSPGSEQAG